MQGKNRAEIQQVLDHAECYTTLRAMYPFYVSDKEPEINGYFNLYFGLITHTTKWYVNFRGNWS